MKKLLFILLMSVAFAFVSFQSSVSAANNTYVVQNGDSLWKISKQFKVSFSEILSLNKSLKNVNLIYPNQKIYLPSGSGTSTSTASHTDNIAQVRQQLKPL